MYRTIASAFLISMVQAQTNEFIAAPRKQSHKSLSSFKEEIAHVAGDIVRTCTKRAHAATKTKTAQQCWGKMHQCMRMQKYALEIVEQFLQEPNNAWAQLKKESCAQVLQKLENIRSELDAHQILTDRQHEAWWRTSAQRIKQLARHPDRKD